MLDDVQRRGAIDSVRLFEDRRRLSTVWKIELETMEKQNKKKKKGKCVHCVLGSRFFLFSPVYLFKRNETRVDNPAKS